MEEDDMVMRVGSSLRMRGERDEPMRREGLQARGIYKEVPRPSRGLALATTKRSLTYRYLIKQIISGGVNHINKHKFLPIYRQARQAAIH